MYGILGGEILKYLIYLAIPLLTGLDTGLILVRKDSSAEWISFLVTGGFALINKNNTTILVNEAFFGSDINLEEAESKYLASKIALETNTDSKKKFELTSHFKKARAKFQISQSFKNMI